MIRSLFLFLALTALPLLADDEFSPVISIASPDTAITFAFGTIKSRALIWNDSTRTLSAEVTFEDEQQTALQPSDDTHRFRIPGIILDKAHGIFYATSASGEAVPVARRKKALFLSTIEVLPNAIVRVFHARGNVSVTLEAIRPSDLARVQKEESDGDTNTNPDGSHNINLRDLLP